MHQLETVHRPTATGATDADGVDRLLADIRDVEARIVALRRQITHAIADHGGTRSTGARRGHRPRPRR